MDNMPIPPADGPERTKSPFDTSWRSTVEHHWLKAKHRNASWLNDERYARKWLILIIIVCSVILVASGSSVSFALYRNSQSTPEKTLSTFCTALLSNNDSLAWNQLSAQFQAELNQALFISFFGGLRTCTPGSLTQTAKATTMPLALVFSARKMTDNTTLKQDNNGDWKIANETGIAGLVQMSASFCDAMQKEDYASAYNQLSLNFQTRLAEDQFALSFAKARFCTYSDLVLTQTPFQITFSLSSPSGVMDTDRTTLVLENGKWKIDDFTNMPTKTLAAFCSDLQSADYQDAYDETSTAFQGGRSLATFAQDFSSVSSCTYSQLVLFNGNVTANISFSYTDGSKITYTAFLVRDSNNAKWKVDQLVNFPNQILTQFCTGLDNQDYQSAYNLLTPEKRAQVTLQAFTANYSNVMRCVFTFPVQTADHATSTLTYTLTDKQTPKQEATLVEYGTDSWGIQSLINT